MKTVQPMTGAYEVTVAATQSEYEPLVCAVYWDEDLESPVLLSRWKPSPEERQRIADGEDLYLGVVTFGQGLQPAQLSVGSQLWDDGTGERASNLDPIRPEEVR